MSFTDWLPKRNKYTINVGLNNRRQSMFSRSLTTWEVHHRAMHWIKAFMPDAQTAIVEGSEPTLVIYGSLMSWPWSPTSDAVKLHALAVGLHQDCIAVMPTEGGGYLVGPGARDWGRFDSAFFYEIDEAHNLAFVANLFRYCEDDMKDQAQIPRNDMRQALEGRPKSVILDDVPATNLSPATVDAETVKVVRDVPALSYKPTHGGYPTQVR